MQDNIRGLRADAEKSTGGFWKEGEEKGRCKGGDDITRLGATVDGKIS